MRTAAVLLILPLFLGCAGNPDPVPVVGGPGDIQELTGEWAGEYGSSETSRSGSIVFRLQAGADTAAGDVVMIPRGARAPLHPMHGKEVVEHSIPDTQLLTIRFVRVQDGQVAGELQPYHEPECDCALHTVFSGRIQGDSVTGTYRTRTPGGPETGGWWRILRR